MKKQTMASALTLTASLLAVASPAEMAPGVLRNNHLIEKSFAVNFRLGSSVPARYINEEGQIIMGRIYVSLDQIPYTPSAYNQLHAEMTGTLYFASDARTADGQFAKVWMPLASGDDGNVLVDLIHRDKDGTHVYQMFGCNSTTTQCSSIQYQLSFQRKSVSLSVQLPPEFQVQLNVVNYVNDREVVSAEWLQEGTLDMVLAPK